jgi:hypothetical protein
MTRPTVVVTAEEKKRKYTNATRYCTSLLRPERKATNKVYHVARVNAFLKQAKKNVVVRKANKKHIITLALKKACNELQLIRNDEGEVEYVPSSPCYCP